jgi:hypothetical protein
VVKGVAMHLDGTTSPHPVDHAVGLPGFGTGADPLRSSGALLFARYAYPPNQLGYCGPADHRALLEYGATGEVDDGLRQLARGFAGAWPYLQLIAESTGIGDPLDREVVEAYWVGNSLLERVPRNDFGNSMRDRFHPRTGRTWIYLEENLPALAVPHHSFHVFAVYPWVGLLGSDRGETPLFVLDRCRIRWGRVTEVTGDSVVVESRPLTWESGVLGLGTPRPEVAKWSTDGYGFARDLAVGDDVSLHWDWVCDKLTSGQLRALRSYTLRQLDITNGQARAGVAAALG